MFSKYFEKVEKALLKKTKTSKKDSTKIEKSAAKGKKTDAVDIIALAKATYRKMVQNLIWATGYNAFAIPLAAGVLSTYGIILNPAVGAVLMSLSTVIVAINARILKVK